MVSMADISMSIDDATKMIIKSQAELLKCMNAMETKLAVMEHLQNSIVVYQGQYAVAKSEFAVLKIEKEHLATNIEVCKKIRSMKSDMYDIAELNKKLLEKGLDPVLLNLL